MPSPKKIIIDHESAGKRLDVFLSAELGISRSQVQKMIEAGQITINGREPKKAGEVVKEGRKISLKHNATITTRLDSRFRGNDKKVAAEKSDAMAEPKIIAETPDYVVVYKPSGLLTHPTQANEKETLSGWLVKKYPAMKKVGDSLSPPPPSRAEGEGKRPRSSSPRFAGQANRAEGENMRPGIVHRLDKEASGLLVVARTQKMFNHLKEQFKNRTIEKEYIVLAHGKVAKDWAEINFPIGRSETSAKMAAMPRTIKGQPSAMGKEAATEFEVEQRFVNFTLLKVKIHTGRMHQIRAHLFAYNHPVVGDPLYFQKKRKNDWDKKCGRLFLHSAKLGFTGLDGEKKYFKSPLPENLKLFLEELK